MNGPCGLRAHLVDQSRRQFLAGAGFAGDRYRRHAAGHARDARSHRLDRRRDAEQQARAVAALGLLRGCLDRFGAAWSRQLQGRADQRAQRIQSDRLGEVIEGAGLERRHRVLGAAVGGDDRHRCVRAARGDQADQLESVAVRQSHVGQAQRVSLLHHQPARLRQIRRHVDVEAHADQRELHQLAQVLLVVDDQDASHARAASQRSHAVCFCCHCVSRD